VYADPHDGLAVVAEESHVATKPEWSFLVLIRALDCIAGQPVSVYQSPMKPVGGNLPKHWRSWSDDAAGASRALVHAPTGADQGSLGCRSGSLLEDDLATVL
jgi:hypothetical protein